MFYLDDYLRRALPQPGDWLPTELRRAAVLCPILAHEGRDHLLFVMRPPGEHAHAGQMAFPGGMQELDESPLQTAMRECFEEVGAPLQAITPLGELPPRDSSSNISVHCVVARVAPFALRPCAREVARVLYMPLDELRNDSQWQHKPPPLATPSQQASVLPSGMGPHFDFGDDLLWGLTARFVRDLLAHLPSSAP